MRLLSLNAWGGNQGGIFFDYINSQSPVTDIFCFQEILNSEKGVIRPESLGGRIHLLQELENLLPEFQGRFNEIDKNHDLLAAVDFPLAVGLATFVKRPLAIEACDYLPVFGGPNQAPDPDIHGSVRGLQHLGLLSDGRRLELFNFHGVANPGDKQDTPPRLQQSEKISSYLRQFDGPKILCGDFNLNPETESIKILERDLRNLIKDFQISNTRNRVSWKQYHNIQHFADFTFVSPEIQVKNFQVPYNEVSDHLPMILEFSF